MLKFTIILLHGTKSDYIVLAPRNYLYLHNKCFIEIHNGAYILSFKHSLYSFQIAILLPCFFFQSFCKIWFLCAHVHELCSLLICGTFAPSPFSGDLLE
jgi:hypothetical protein